MNKPVSPLEAAMLALRATCPPTGVIHVGAGHGRGVVHTWRTWGVEHAVLLEADSTRFGWAHELAGHQPHWHAIDAVVAAADGDATYYTASNPDEDGLVKPDLLAQLWPRLGAASTGTRSASTLDALLAPLPHTDHLNWLIVDCFGTAQILEGAQEALARADVIVLRSIRDTQSGALAPSSHARQADQIRTAGLEALPFFESTHPLAGHAVFVRPVSIAQVARHDKLASSERAARKEADAMATRLDTATEELRVLRDKLDDAGAKLTQATAAQAAAERCRDEQAAEIAALATEKENHRRSAKQLRSELEACSAGHATLQTAMDSAVAAHVRDRDALAGKLDEQRYQLDQGMQALSALKEERDDLVKAAAKQKGKLSELEQARRDLADELAQRMQQYTALEQAMEAKAARLAQEEQARQKLARELKELHAAGQARQEKTDRMSRQLSEYKARAEKEEAEYSRTLERMAELESENQRIRHQHSVMHDELIKGEAQIELIKDLLLRDAGI